MTSSRPERSFAPKALGPKSGSERLASLRERARKQGSSNPTVEDGDWPQKDAISEPRCGGRAQHHGRNAVVHGISHEQPSGLRSLVAHDHRGTQLHQTAAKETCQHAELAIRG